MFSISENLIKFCLLKISVRGDLYKTYWYDSIELIRTNPCEKLIDLVKTVKKS